MFERVWRHYSEWEETHAGLWRRVAGMERDELINKCSVFMADTSRFKAGMLRAIDEWPVSCEVNFTTPSLNRQAWLGHAACCIAIGCPEEPTRAAWWTLTQEQRDAGDEAAAETIKEWERRYSERPKLCVKNQLALMF